MSQKVNITRVEVTGARPYLGIDSTFGAPRFSDNPDVVMRWLCGAWRYRFNMARGNRSKYWLGSKDILRSIGEPDDRTNKETREDIDWMCAVPSAFLYTAVRMEDTEWWAAVKRRKTNGKKGLKPGAMPGFRKAKSGLWFAYYLHNGKYDNFTFTRYSKRHGEIVFGGMNPPNRRLPGEKARWQVRIHVRLTGPVRDFTSIRVDWSKKILVFVNPPGERGHEATGRRLGLDMGVTHAVTDSDGNFHDLPIGKLKSITLRIGNLSRAKARCVRESGYADEREYLSHAPSNRYLKLRRRIRALYAKRSRIVEDWQHKLSARLVAGNDVIAMEDLKVRNMTRRPKARPDPNNPGHWLPNGRSAKAGLNSNILLSSWGRFRRMLEYKARAAHIRIMFVNPAYTSQRCHVCGFTSSENRESQAVFRCQRCGWTGNADVNAAMNILHDGMEAMIPVRAGHVRCAETGYKTMPSLTAKHGGPFEAQNRLHGDTPRTGIPSL